MSARSLNSLRVPIITRNQVSNQQAFNSTSVGSCWGLIMKQASALGGRARGDRRAEIRENLRLYFGTKLRGRGKHAMLATLSEAAANYVTAPNSVHLSPTNLALRCLHLHLLRLANSISFTLLSLPLLSLPFYIYMYPSVRQTSPFGYEIVLIGRWLALSTRSSTGR